MNTQENNIPLLQEVLDQFDDGTLDMTQRARKCYMSEKEKHFGRVTWVHNDELKTHSLLRNMAKKGSKDLLKQTREKL
jgi:hypothetical protein